MILTHCIGATNNHLHVASGKQKDTAGSPHLEAVLELADDALHGGRGGGRRLIPPARECSFGSCSRSPSRKPLVFS